MNGILRVLWDGVLNKLKSLMTLSALLFGSLVTFFGWISTFICSNEAIKIFLIIYSPISVIIILILIQAIIEDKKEYNNLLKKNLADYHGYEYDYIEVEINIKIDGSSINKTIYEMISKSDSLNSKEHFSFFIGCAKANINNEISLGSDSKAEDSDISFQNINVNKHLCLSKLLFSPNLKTGKRATYIITQKIEKGVYLMTLEEILKKIAKGEWATKEPCEAHRQRVKYPLKKLVCKIIFPKEYKIKGEHFFDVTFLNSCSRHEEEYNRLIKNNSCPTPEIVGDNKIVTLTVDHPKIGLEYWVKWQPPPREEYQKILQK